MAEIYIGSFDVVNIHGSYVIINFLDRFVSAINGQH
jgi:hypothetical protein